MTSGHPLDPALTGLAIPRDDDGPVFAEPWQAQAFALTLRLHEQGQFSWPEWADMLSAEIAAAAEKGSSSGNEGYYLCWLAALEKIVTAKNLATAEELAARKRVWRTASEHTPHGQPIELTQK